MNEPIVIPSSPDGWQFPATCPACRVQGEGDSIWEVDVGMAPHEQGQATLARCIECHHVQPFILRYRDGDDEESRRRHNAKMLANKPGLTEDELFAALEAEAAAARSRWRAVYAMWKHWRVRAHTLELDMVALKDDPGDGAPVGQIMRLAEASGRADSAQLEMLAMAFALENIAEHPEYVDSPIRLLPSMSLSEHGASIPPPMEVRPSSVRGVFEAMRRYARASYANAREAREALEAVRNIREVLGLKPDDHAAYAGESFVRVAEAAGQLGELLERRPDLDDELHERLKELREALNIE